MDIRLVSVNSGVKNDKLWCQASFKLTRDDGKSVIITEWLNGVASEQAIALGRGNNMPLVTLKLDYGDNFRVAIKNIEPIDEMIDFN